jgi:hypothetical protein
MYQIAGFGKYGAAAFAASTPLLLVLSTSTAWAFAFYPLALVAALILFYAVEAQFVFLFPLLLEHKPRPIAASILLTRSVGGTLATMRRILPIAAHMLFGGLLGKGFLRSWLRGCLAVLIWYRQVYDPTRA